MSDILTFTNNCGDLYQALQFEYSTAGITQLKSFYPKVIFTEKPRTPHAVGSAHLRYGVDSEKVLIDGWWLVKCNDDFSVGHMVMTNREFKEFYATCTTKEPEMISFISAQEASALTLKAISEGTTESNNELRIISNAISEIASSGKTELYYSYRVSDLTIARLKKLEYNVKFTDDQRDGPMLYISWT